MDNVLVICHGHQDRPINEVNYATAKFLNIDDETEPNYVMDIIDYRVPQWIGRKFDVVINAFCPISIEFRTFTDAIFDRHGTIIDGDLNPMFFGNIWKLLNPGGQLYCRPIFSLGNVPDPTAISLLTDKLYRFGFAIDHLNRTLTFGKTIISDFIVYRKIPIPSRQELWKFLAQRLVQSPTIVALQLQVYNSEMDLIETYRVKLNETDFKWLEGDSDEESNEESDEESNKESDGESNEESNEESDIFNLERVRDLIVQPQFKLDDNDYAELRSLILIRNDNRTIRLM